MQTLEPWVVDQLIEQRYVSLVRLGAGLSLVTDWHQLATAVSDAFTAPVNGVRIWVAFPEGYQDMARHPPDLSFAPPPLRDLRRAADIAEPVPRDDGTVLIALRSVGWPLGVLELATDGNIDLELAAHAAPLIATRAAMLLAVGVGGLAPPAGGDADDAEISAAIRTFAAEAKHVLDHDRLSAYLVTLDGRAVERFAVATSQTLPDEGIIVPFAEFGLRHILVSNRGLVSADLGRDSRIVGREDRVIAQAGFHGLVSVPLRLQGEAFGVLNFVSRARGFYTEQDVAVAQQIADQAAAFFAVLRRQRRTRIWMMHSAAEHERARLARELHDTLVRALPQVGDHAREIGSDFAPLDARLAERLGTLGREVDRITADTRRALLGLAPPALDAHAVEDVIRSELDTLEETKDLEANLSLQGDTARLSPAVRRGVYRIVQEAISNIRLHAGASKVEVDLTVGSDATLTIEDDGCGFVRGEASRDRGLGLRFMAERAHWLGGTIQVRSTPGAGTCITCELPGADAMTRLGEPTVEHESLEQAGGVRLRVYVIEPEPLMLAGIVHVLRREADIRVVGASSDGADAHAHIFRRRPDVVLLDVDHDPVGRRALIHELSLASPTTEIIATTARPGMAGREFVAQGARGVASKRLPGPAFVEEITRALEGDRPAEAAAPTWPPGRPAPAELSAREREMLTLIASGRTNAEIAEALFLARKTIERNVMNLVAKLGARNRAHAAAVAVASGLVTPIAGD